MASRKTVYRCQSIKHLIKTGAFMILSSFVQVSQPTSLYRLPKDTRFVAPVVILAALVLVLSTSFLPYWLQLSYIISPYSSSGLINAIYSFKIFEIKFTHDMNSGPSFLLNIINMLMLAAIIREV